MTNSDDFINDFHWIIDVIQFIDVGVVILDKEFQVQTWNAFMQNHSALGAESVLGQNIFGLFPELPEAWFRRKADSVFSLQNSAFTTWEQRPYLFKFKSYRPITSLAEYMYQNSTIIPLKNTRGEVNHICIILYDVTEAAVNRIQIQEANEQLRLISRTDGLTGLLNRKTWEQELEQEFLRYKRHKHTCSLMIFDIDHFKRVNDGFGHPAGDEVIRQTAQILTETIREIDVSGRYGGEEYVVILPDTDSQGAMILAERVRKKIEENRIHYEGNDIDYTISIGIAELTDDIPNRTHWIDRADQCLYKAKESGRNNCQAYDKSNN